MSRGPWTSKRRTAPAKTVSRAASTPPLSGGSPSQAATEYRTVLAERLKYLVPVDQPLVLIAQPGRSGGTLLLRMFDGHPQCHVVPYELQQIFRGMATDLRDPDSAWRRLAADKQFERSRPFLLRPGLQRAIFEARLAELDDPGPREIMDCYFTSFFNGWLDNRNLRATPKRWVIGFEPGGTLKLDAHSRLYPDGRVLSLVRDPWGWYASRRMKQRKWGDRKVAVDTWCAEVTAALRLQADDPDRVVLVLFSDLLGRTEVTMRALAHWLDVDFVPSLLEPSFNGIPARARSSFDDVGTEITPGPLHRGEDLSREDTSYIDRSARELYDQAVASAIAVEPAHRRD